MSTNSILLRTWVLNFTNKYHWTRTGCIGTIIKACATRIRRPGGLHNYIRLTICSFQRLSHSGTRRLRFHFVVLFQSKDFLILYFSSYLNPLKFFSEKLSSAPINLHQLILCKPVLRFPKAGVHRLSKLKFLWTDLLGNHQPDTNVLIIF